RARVCVATDVAARGLDLPDLGLVIHADPPQNAQVLVHRSGRTGRAGKHGLAIMLVADHARRGAERMFNAAHLDVTWKLAPSADDIRMRDRDHLAGEVDALAAETADEDRAIAQSLLAKRSAEELVAALVRVRREQRPAPEELTVPPSMRPRPPREQREQREQREPRESRKQPPQRAPREEPGARERAGVWFTINVGRSKHADPKWLVPLLCRRGDVTKRAIGKIE